MVSSDGTAMIADFGNAQLKDLMYTLKFTGTTKRGISVRWAVWGQSVAGMQLINGFSTRHQNYC